MGGTERRVRRNARTGMPRTGEPAALAEPRLGKRSVRLSDEEFYGRYVLLFNSISHELGNSTKAIDTLEKELRGAAALAKVASLDERISLLRISYGLEIGQHRLRNILKIIYYFEHGEMAGEMRYLDDATRISLGLDENKKPTERTTRKAIEYFVVKEMETLLSVLGDAKKELLSIAERRDEEMLFHFNRVMEFGTYLAWQMKALCEGREQNGIVSWKIRNFLGRISFICKSEGKERIAVQLGKLEENAELHVRTNPMEVMLIVHNLVSNAKRSAREKEVEPKMDVSLEIVDRIARFRFTDNGNGMPPEVMDALNGGRRISTKPTDAPGEHGLGFQTCREFAKRMGGKQYIERSEPKVGTTVVLELQLAA
ncbi:MAG: ATP-binding protein [Candidatus Micrarchaeia archaeon]